MNRFYNLVLLKCWEEKQCFSTTSSHSLYLNISVVLHKKELNFMFLFSTWNTYILWDFVILNKLIEAYGNKTEPVVDVWQSKWYSAN